MCTAWHTLSSFSGFTCPVCCADDSALARLDSSIKKNSAFIKRLKQQLGDEAGHKALLADVLKLNLSKVCQRQNAKHVLLRGASDTHWLHQSPSPP